VQLWRRSTHRHALSKGHVRYVRILRNTKAERKVSIESCSKRITKVRIFVISEIRNKYFPRINSIIDLRVYPTLKPFLYYKVILFFSQALQPPWALAPFSVSWSFLQTVGLLGRVISSSQGLYLNTGQHKHRINTYTKHPSFRESEDSSCLRPLGYCDRPQGYSNDLLSIW
jgi:hypothetical protein